VDEGGAPQERQRVEHHALDPVPVDLAHREDPRVQPAEKVALALVE